MRKKRPLEKLHLTARTKVTFIMFFLQVAVSHGVENNERAGAAAREAQAARDACAEERENNASYRRGKPPLNVVRRPDPLVISKTYSVHSRGFPAPAVCVCVFFSPR